MQNAETILEILHERGKKGLPLERVYRLLFNPELYLLAYGKIYRNRGAISPILSNIYFDRLDQFVEQTLIPENTQGDRRRRNPEWHRLSVKAADRRKLGNREEARRLEKQYQTLPSQDPNDPGYRRLRYIRYADDFLLGFAGPKAEAETIKEKLATYLRDHLKLEMSTEKTLITHATRLPARFLGYDIVTQNCDTKYANGQRGVNGSIGLRIPGEVIEARCAQYQQGRKEGRKPIQRTELLADDDYSIIVRYQSEYRGYVQYYLLAVNVTWLGKLHWVMETSLTKTLANKHKVSVLTIYQRYADKIETPYGPRKCLKAALEREGAAVRLGVVSARKDERDGSR